VAKLLEELDRVGNRETPIVLGVLAAEDLAMAAILPIAAVVVSGEPLVQAAPIAAGALAVAGLAMLVAVRYGPLLARSSDAIVDALGAWRLGVGKQRTTAS
jgi:CPA2 family monovalent cation:H+ antiporter-2